MKDVRAESLAHWARGAGLNVDIPETASLTPVSDDASFRRYFRFDHGVDGIIFVDAPPNQEDNEGFVKVARALNGAHLTCPRVLAVDFDLGFLAITDLGDRLYLDELTEHPLRLCPLYDEASAAIIRLLSVRCELPHYDASRLKNEMALFHEWFVTRQMNLTLTGQEQSMLTAVYELLTDNALAQPTGFVHRDYHSRNLMVVEKRGPGIIDFQDAVIGPVTYDLVSLYKDCYYQIDRQEVVDRVEAFRQQLISHGVVDRSAPFLRWFDLMGAQRHLKCAGIFSRLNLRDGKSRYLGDIPLVIDYLVEVSAIYPELESLHRWLRSQIVPGLADAGIERRASL